MRIISASATNFASYKQIDFDFQNQGLTLIQGPTGAGKSTLCDLIPWGIFGRTAKDGAVSEILAWPGDVITKVTIHVEVAGVFYHIFRSRGPLAKDNDLCWMQDTAWDTPKSRGKDLPDTQRLINQLLGFDYNLYLAGAYYHEFSQTAQFFTTTAKNRRAICEQLVDLTLAVKLQHRLSDEYKTANKTRDMLNNERQQLTSSINTLGSVKANADKRRRNWDMEHLAAHASTLNLMGKFEKSRKTTVSKTCPTCSTVLIKPHTHIDDSPNPYVARLEAIEAEVNPHTDSVKDHTKEIDEKIQALAVINAKASDTAAGLLDIELLQQVVNDYRSVSIANTIAEIETNTNKLLSDHFDAEIRVQFDIADADKIDVQVYKDGNNATFQQLSKGQRGMLKLCFGISVMQAVQNHHGIDFGQVFFDEATDGFSDTLKLKAVRMLQTIRQDVYLVEHSEALKAMIDNQYLVTLTPEGSQIEKA